MKTPRSDDWYLREFHRIYAKEPKALEFEQFKKSYYIPDHRDDNFHRKKGGRPKEIKV